MLTAAQQSSVIARRSQARYSTPLSFRDRRQDHRAASCVLAIVKNGAVVARLDPADRAEKRASAQAQLAAAQHSLVYAKQQLDRDQAQAKENLIAPAQLEQTTNAYASAAAQRDQAAQQAALSKDQLQYTTLAADHAGVITAEQADTGQNVSAGQAVYNLAWSGDVDVVVRRAGKRAGRAAVGQTAKVTLPRCRGASSAPACASCRLPPIRKAAPIAPNSRSRIPARTCASA
jgi:multidrug efflux system membrane fusion protein